MVIAGVVDQLAHIFAAQAAAGQARQRVRLVLQGVLKGDAVDVELVGSEGSYLQFLKVEGWEWAAGEIVALSDVAHRGPVADHCSLESCRGTLAAGQLLNGLCAVED